MPVLPTHPYVAPAALDDLCPALDQYPASQKPDARLKTKCVEVHLWYLFEPAHKETTLRYLAADAWREMTNILDKGRGPVHWFTRPETDVSPMLDGELMHSAFYARFYREGLEGHELIARTWFSSRGARYKYHDYADIYERREGAAPLPKIPEPLVKLT